MKAIVQFVMMHGYSALFATVVARQIGLPVPAALFLRLIRWEVKVSSLTSAESAVCSRESSHA
jgi:hypothetical protein